MYLTVWVYELVTPAASHTSVSLSLCSRLLGALFYLRLASQDILARGELLNVRLITDAPRQGRYSVLCSTILLQPFVLSKFQHYRRHVDHATS